MSKFVTDLETRYLGYKGWTKWWELTAPLRYYCSRTDRMFKVPEGFVTDFASFRRVSWVLIAILLGSGVLANLIFNANIFQVTLTLAALYAVAWWIWGERAHRAAVLHDYLYRQGEIPRTLADLIFKDAILSTGYSRFIGIPMFLAVYTVGWMVYKPQPDCLNNSCCDNTDIEECRHCFNYKKRS